MNFKNKEGQQDSITNLVEYVSKISELDDVEQIARKLEEMVSFIITAEYTTVWIHDSKTDEFYSFKNGVKNTIKLEDSLLYKSFKDEKYCIANSVHENPLFLESIDNFYHYKVKNVLITPIVEEHNVVGIIESFIVDNYFHQFIQDDADMLMSLSTFLSKMFKFIDNPKMKCDSEKLQHTIEDIESIQRQAKEESEKTVHMIAESVHDIRNFMSGITGFLEILKAENSAQENIPYINNALKSSEMMMAIINDLLDYTKMSKGKIKIEKIEFELLEELKSIGLLFCSKVKDADVTFRTFFDPNLPKMLTSDPLRIKQIISNFLSNAIKFTPKGGIIDLAVTFDKASRRVKFSVKDTGIGISKDRQEAIFEEYEQEKESTSRNFGGTGLGLSITLKLVKMLGGELKLESQEGQGSDFSFYLDSDVNTCKFAPLKTKNYRVTILHDRDMKKPLIDLLVKYLNSFGIHDIEYAIDCVDETIHNRTHIFCTKYKIDTQKAKVFLEANPNVEFTVIKDRFLKNYKEHISGRIKEIDDCLISSDYIYNALSGLSEQTLESHTKEVHLEGKVVLVVDDNELSRVIMKRVLTKFGLEILMAENGIEAVKTFKDNIGATQPISLIFMDQKMPKMDGDEATKMVRELEKIKKLNAVPIIGFSGDGSKEEFERLTSIGMNDCAFKPISLKKITEILNTYIK